MPISEALKKAQARYTAKNKEKIAERKRAYVAKNRALYNEAQSRWRAANPEENRKRMAAWREAQKAAKPPKPSKQEQFYSLVGEAPDLSLIDPRQRTIIEAYYGLNGEKPQSELKIAEFFRTTRQNINLQRKQALEKLKSK